MSAAQADAFYRQVLAGRHVLHRVRRRRLSGPGRFVGISGDAVLVQAVAGPGVIDHVAAYAAFEVEEIALGRWREDWLPDLGRDGLLVSINWSGTRANGYDISTADVVRNLDARRSARA